jgi:hypothetical protein
LSVHRSFDISLEHTQIELQKVIVLALANRPEQTTTIIIIITITTNSSARIGLFDDPIKNEQFARQNQNKKNLTADEIEKDTPGS